MDEAKERSKKIWSTGDYSPFSRHMAQASTALVESLGIGSGDRVLDVAAGDGNLAIAAARRGASVVATDFSEVMLATGRARAADEGLDIEWEFADAEDLPFDGDSFDFVTSVFGVMFAPDQQQAAAELVRVTKAGGTVGVAAWTPEGQTGELFRALDRFGPPSDPDEPNPLLWGTEAGIETLFEGAGIRYTRRVVTFEFPSWDAVIADHEAHGVMVVAKQQMPPETYVELIDTMTGVLRNYDRAADEGVLYDSEYLETLITKD